jgi:HAMP domain-containing protein
MGEWLGLIGAVLGTAIGGVIAYYTTGQQHRHERSLENHRRLIASYEAIHELLSTIAGQATTLNMGVIGDLGYATPLKGDLLKEKIQLDRLRMLVDFYAPALKDDVRNISDQFAIVFRAVGEVILKKNRDDAWKGKTVESVAIASIEITKLTQEAQVKLASLVQPLVAQG